MTPLRFSMLTATLLAFAATVHGQAPPPEPTCPCSGLAGWLTPYLQQSMQTWQRVRTLATGQKCEYDVSALVGMGSPGCCKLGSCATGAAGCAKCCETVQAPASCCCAKACASCDSCKAKKDATSAGQTWPAEPQYQYVPPAPAYPSPMERIEAQLKNIARLQAEHELKIAEFYQRTGHPGAAQFYLDLLMRHNGPMLPTMPSPMAHQAMQVQAIPMPPMMNFGFPPLTCAGPLAMALPFDCPHAPSMPVPPPPPMARQVVQVHAIPGAPMCMPPASALTPDLHVPCCKNAGPAPQPPFAVVELPDCIAAAPAVKHAHLVTPDLEAHCVRMTHRGDTIILEGDVILLNKKHAQPIRIEAQRAIINMKDGTITVDGPPSNSNFGVTRTSAVAPVVERVQVEERCVHLIRLRNVPADDVVRSLAVQVAHGKCLGEIRLEADAKSNLIRVEGTTKNVELISKMAAELDRMPSDRFQRIVLPLKNIDASQAALLQRLCLGGDRTLLRVDGGVKLHNLRMTFDEHTNSIIVEGAGEDVASVLKTIAELDRVPHAPVRPATIVVPRRE